MNISKEVRDLIAPSGRLRAAINVGNPILARREGPSTASGVSVDLSQELANLLEIPLEICIVDAARFLLKK
ncbi:MULTISPECIES: hypothetical protein [Pseudomonas]|uniref:Uncharacterized protein n=1 Tax=Pseudomonas putida TaxID=303 RepID=A0AAW6PRJ1_PSEPU|nr:MULTISPECIES: hypothetical protein [Pseudomonas]MBH3469066.1 hypothetical protein [Pseudomonas putida]MCE0778715.1 hypothetical protein [Pseudomonas sp. NMI542_15]MCE1021649.1 hypothetical protein [Pseudomonas monteilii]MCE1038943.1 hypothetical protein [Pseudomonas monteilii]MCE1090863.1 hypothetical protein [Pseudomonas monteilii]